MSCGPNGKSNLSTTRLDGARRISTGRAVGEGIPPFNYPRQPPNLVHLTTARGSNTHALAYADSGLLPTVRRIEWLNELRLNHRGNRHVLRSNLAERSGMPQTVSPNLGILLLIRPYDSWIAVTVNCD